MKLVIYTKIFFPLHHKWQIKVERKWDDIWVGHHYWTLFFCTMLRVIVAQFLHAVLNTSCVTGIYPVKSVTGGQKALIFSIKTTKYIYQAIRPAAESFQCIQSTRHGHVKSVPAVFVSLACVFKFLPVQFHVVWSTLYSPVFLSVSALPNFATWLTQILPKQNTDFVHFIYCTNILNWPLNLALLHNKKKVLACQSTDRAHWSNGVDERSKCKHATIGQQWKRSDPMAYRHCQIDSSLQLVVP